MTDVETLEMIAAIKKDVTPQDIHFHKGIINAENALQAEAVRAVDAMLKFFEHKRSQSCD